MNPMIKVNYTQKANSTFKVLTYLGFFSILNFYLSVGEGVVLQVRVAVSITAYSKSKSFNRKRAGEGVCLMFYEIS